MLVPASAAISRMLVASKPFSAKPRIAASMIASRVVLGVALAAWGSWTDSP